MPNDDTIPTISEIKGNTILQLLTNVYDTLKKAIFKKQNKLIAGDNIVIDEVTNTISAIEGGTPVLDNYYTKPQTDALLDEKADVTELNEKANVSDVYSKTDVDELLSEKENIISAGNNITIITGADNNKTIKLSDNINREGTTNLVGNTNITGNITVTGNITQNGESYETHAEKIYTENDYIVTRDGAEGALASGDYSGIEIEKYDGINNCRLAVDSLGVARVGDVGDEEPLLTRDESNNLSNGQLLKWSSSGLKATGEGTVGTDTKPIKIVNGIATAITKDVLTVDGGTLSTNKFIEGVVAPYNTPFRVRSNQGNSNIYVMDIYDNNGNKLIGLYVTWDNNTGAHLAAVKRNADGTYSYPQII